MEFFEKIKKIIMVGVIIIVILIFTVIVFFTFKKNMPSSSSEKINTSNFEKVVYTIPGVPYYGTFNHIEGSISNPFNIVASIAGYWGESAEINVSEMDKSFDSSKGMIYNIVSLFSTKGFSAQVVRLDIADLKKYINPEIKTPLILFLPISSDQPASVTYYSAMVLFGIDEKKQKLVFHNHWLGNNYEISFEEFGELENKLPIDQRNKYIIIQPRNLSEKLKELSQKEMQPYAKRISILQNGEQMFKDHAIGAGALELRMEDVSLLYLSKAENSPNFDEFFPPFFKMLLYYEKAKAFFIKHDFDNALRYAQRAVDMDHDLNKPFKDWSGIQIDWGNGSIGSETDEPYYLLGYIYKQKKDFQKARENYNRVLEISPNDINAKNELEVLDALEK